MVATLKDVARLAGVSPSAVSNALHHRELVNQEVLVRIESAIETLGYVPSHSARQLRLGKSSNVTAVMLDAFIPFFAEVARGIEETLESAGLDVVFSDSRRDPQRQERQVRAALYRKDHGIILCPTGDVEDLLTSIQRTGARVVLVSPEREYPGIASVRFDDFGGGYMAAMHAIRDANAKRLLFIGDSSIFHARQRLEGARSAVAANPSCQLEVQESVGLGLEPGANAAMSYLSSAGSELPDAVFCANDMTALGALQAILASGLRCPDDLALIGFDDTFIAQQALIPLTSVRQPAWEMGSAAAQLLTANAEDARSQLFTGRVIARESTGHRQSL